MRFLGWALIMCYWSPDKKRTLDTQRHQGRTHRRKNTRGRRAKAAIRKPWRDRLQKKPALLTPPSCTSNLQDFENVNFCYFRHSICSIFLWKPWQTP